LSQAQGESGRPEGGRFEYAEGKGELLHLTEKKIGTKKRLSCPGEKTLLRGEKSTSKGHQKNSSSQARPSRTLEEGRKVLFLEKLGTGGEDRGFTYPMHSTIGKKCSRRKDDILGD